MGRGIRAFFWSTGLRARCVEGLDRYFNWTRAGCFLADLCILLIVRVLPCILHKYTACNSGSLDGSTDADMHRVN